MIRYWFKILRSEENALPLVVYRMLKLDVDNSITYNGINWAFQIKTYLETPGFSNISLNQDVTSVSFSVIKQRILDV